MIMEKTKANSTQKASLIMSIVSMCVIGLFFLFGTDANAGEALNKAKKNESDISTLTSTVSDHTTEITLHTEQIGTIKAGEPGVAQDIKTLTEKVNSIEVEQGKISENITFIKETISKKYGE